MRPVPNLPEPEEPTSQLCAFFLGAEEYAVDVMRLEEILRPQRVTPVPGAPPFVAGVLNLRGAIVPVLEARERLGAGPALNGRKARLLVCRIGPGKVALPVDAVSGIVRVRRSELRPPPATPGGPAPLVVGVFGPPERLRLLLNVRALLEPAPQEKAR